MEGLSTKFFSYPPVLPFPRLPRHGQSHIPQVPASNKRHSDERIMQKNIGWDEKKKWIHCQKKILRSNILWIFMHFRKVHRKTAIWLLFCVDRRQNGQIEILTLFSWHENSKPSEWFLRLIFMLFAKTTTHIGKKAAWVCFPIKGSNVGFGRQK